MNTKKIVVIGAGPAGMMAAIRAAQLHKEVLLIEKNPIPGKKLLLSGKGRCNITNSCDLDSFLERFSKGGAFLRDAFAKFFNQDLIRFFQERGLKLKVERQLRVFPVTDSSFSIVEVLRKELDRCKVEVCYKSSLKDILVKDGRVCAVSLGDGALVPADKVVLATGGVSYRFTGSNGEGLKIAGRLGHKVTALSPGLVPLVVKQEYPKLLEGLTLKNIRLKFCAGKKCLTSDIGELMFTDFGVSGPLVLSLSGRVIDLFEQGCGVFMEIDLKPALSSEQVKERLLREFSLSSKKSVKNILKSLLPQRLIELFIDILKIDPLKKANQVSRLEREALVLLLKSWRLDIGGARSIEEAMITRGGVSLKEINPRTMESRLIKGLYFAGEIMDLDADTGGFNLQTAFSTGYLAGESAAGNQ